MRVLKSLASAPGKILDQIFFILIVLLPAVAFAQAQSKQTTDTAKQPGIYLSNLKQIARVTGTPLEGETYPSPSNTPAFDVDGTDLGIFWEMDSGRVGIFFGDTYGRGFIAGKGGGNGTNWRSNVLAFSNDVDLDDGITIKKMALDSSGKAKEICAGTKSLPGNYQTSIPTAAIRAAGVDYVHYMNIYEWAGQNGRWLTNFSSVYASADGGETWVRKEQVTFKSDSRFSQVCYAKKGGYIYMIGTLAGRGSAAYLARFKESDMLDLKQYEYWNGGSKKWIKDNEQAATVIIPGPVGEASLLYHEKYKRWIIAYSYDAAYDPKYKKKMHALAYRDAEELNGTWSDMKLLITEKDYPGLYSPFFHPLKNNETKLYFTMSLWSPYNVFLMAADINAL